jgi:hypothetical protein
MLAIITSFLSRQTTREWDVHCWLLERAVESMVGGANEGITAVVVCHELPEIARRNRSRVEFLQVDFAPPEIISDAMCVDKVCKLSYGLDWAIDNGFEYVMVSDADDLVSNKLFPFVTANRGHHGWLSKTVLMHAYGSRWVRLAAGFSAPSAIFRSENVTFAEPPFDRGLTKMLVDGGEANYLHLLTERRRRVSTMMAAGCTNYPLRAVQEGLQLEAFPFPATLMISHRSSMSWIPGGLAYRGPAASTVSERVSDIKTRIRRMRSASLVTQRIRDEFSMPDPRRLPANIRRRGSTFDR